ncbi:MAG: alkaline phosphatase D family protein [Burkholderiales bacterium]|nr:alkaline phosphatase D family protein [Burkholderiales bacterium]
MDPLWKLPPFELKPLPGGAWAVQSEAGLGPALAVFAPLRRQGASWVLALSGDDSVDLTPANDRSWTPVPFPTAPQAERFLCMLRYDQPGDRPGGTFGPLLFRPDDGDAGHATITGADLRAALDTLQRDTDLQLELQMVSPPDPPPAPAGSAAPADAAPPDPLPDTLCFAFASCQYPAGLLDRRIAHGSYARLAQALQQAGGPRPERLLLVGDQVYTDATYGLLDPARLDDRYRLPYEAMQDRANGPFALLPQDFLARRRMMPDDHEIVDNWEPGPPGTTDPRVKPAMEAYWTYQRRSDPEPEMRIRECGPGWWLFMADSRTQRMPRDETNVDQALILGQAQTVELEEWLESAPADKLKIVTTASMLLPRTRICMDEPLYLDPWQGYPASLHRLLAFLYEKNLRNVVFLSGDAHIACDARITVRRRGAPGGVRFASFHAPALYAPFPFANEEPANFLLQEDFSFQSGGNTYECEVRASLPAGRANGCGLLHATRAGPDWDVTYQVLA